MLLHGFHTETQASLPERSSPRRLDRVLVLGLVPWEFEDPKLKFSSPVGGMMDGTHLGVSASS